MLSLNTRGIGGYKKRRKVFNYLKKHSSHNAVIFLQETHSTKIVEKVWINQWGCGSGNIIFSHGASDSRGVLIAFREGLDIEIKTCLCDKNGPYIILHAHIQDNPIRWEFLKYKMRQFSRTYSKEKAFERKSAHLTLEKKVKELESQIRSNSDEALVEQYNKSNSIQLV